MMRVILCLCSLVASVHAVGGDRRDAFIGYHEKGGECQDQLDTCHKQALNGGCLEDPYTMRVFCPISCNVERCTVQGSLKIPHKGHASPAGTLAFQARSKQRHVPESNFRNAQLYPAADTLRLSSLGIGTYLGQPDAPTDEQVTTAVIYSVSHGWNVIDTASNYRGGRAEESVGSALDALLAGASTSDFPNNQAYRTDITRDMLFVATKAGYMSPSLLRKLIRAKAVPRGEVVADTHCIHPACLKESLDESLSRLNLEKVDLLYLHNSAEAQLEVVGRAKYLQRLGAAFTFLESARASGEIRFYGLATWDCFRKVPGHPQHLSLQDVVTVAEKVGGAAHGLRFVQLPVNAAMPEAWQAHWQTIDSRPNVTVSLTEAAAALHVHVFTSGPLLQSELARLLTSRLDNVLQLREQGTTAQKLLQLARSSPGALTTLVGHKSREYVEQNLALSKDAALSGLAFQEAAAAVTAVVMQVQREGG